MKKKSWLSVLIFILTLVFIPNAKAEELSNNQKALMETATAYYNKKGNIQYCAFRWNNYFSPEDATKDDNKYTVCSGFTFNTYREAFNIILPAEVNLITAAGYNYYTKRKNASKNPEHDFLVQLNDSEITSIKKTLEKSHSHETTDKKKAFGLAFLREIENNYTIKLKVGDMVALLWSDSGHVVIVKDITRENGVIKTIKYIHSTGDNKTKTTKLSINQNYNNKGTIKIGNLNDYIGNVFLYNTGRTYKYLTIYRPLVNDNTYNKYDCKSSLNTDSDYNMNNYTCTKESKNYQITSQATSRMKYSGIDIDKVVTSGTSNKNIINNSTVNFGDELIYKITISNKGATNYQDTISLVENISDLVEFKEFVNKDGNTCELSNNKVSCTIKQLNSGASTTVEYKVKVKTDVNFEKKIISTGNVDTNLKTATITNLIKADTIDEEKLTNAYNELKDSTTLSGIDFVNEVYKRADLGLEFNLDNFDITQLISNNMTDWSPVRLNENSSYKKYILNDYYSSILNKTQGSNRYMYLKEWGINHKLYGETAKGVTHQIDDIDRADTVYKNHFKTGDILIYKNDSDDFMKENGDYAFIFVNGNFYGINNLTDGTDKNIFDVNATIDTGNTNQSNYPYLTTLFGKDYYVILRPSLEKIDTREIIKVESKATLTEDGVISVSRPVVSKETGKFVGYAVESKTIYHPERYVLSNTVYNYNGNLKRPSVKIYTSNNKKIITDFYNLKYSNYNSKKVGVYTITVTYKGAYFTGKKVLTYIIRPKTVKLKKVKALKKSFKAYWKKNTTQTTGYQLIYSTDKKFKKKYKKVTIRDNEQLAKTIKKLKGKQTYYVSIRTYKTIKNGYVFSEWSNIIKVKTK